MEAVVDPSVITGLVAGGPCPGGWERLWAAARDSVWLRYCGPLSGSVPRGPAYFVESFGGPFDDVE